MANNPDETDVGFDSVISQMFKVCPQQMKAVLLVSPVCASKLQMPFDAVRLVLASFIPTTLYPITYARDVLCDVPSVPTGKKKDVDLIDLSRLVLIGDSKCGKTSFLLRYFDGHFSTYYSATIGVDFKVKF